MFIYKIITVIMTLWIGNGAVRMGFTCIFYTNIFLGGRYWDFNTKNYFQIKNAIKVLLFFLVFQREEEEP